MMVNFEKFAEAAFIYAMDNGQDVLSYLQIDEKTIQDLRLGWAFGRARKAHIEHLKAKNVG